MSNYRVGFMVNFRKPEYHPVTTPAEGAALLHELSRAELVNPACWASAGGLEVLIDGEWEQWEDAEGYDIDAYDENFVFAEFE
jgi:hypothetical protein